MTLADRVKYKRIELGLSQEELAKRMGYSSRTSINKIENGRKVSQKIIVRLAEVLDVTPAYLMGWEDEIKENIEKDPIGTANEFAELLMDQEVRLMIKDYIGLTDEKKKQIRDFIRFIKDN